VGVEEARSLHSMPWNQGTLVALKQHIFTVLEVRGPYQSPLLDQGTTGPRFFRMLQGRICFPPSKLPEASAVLGLWHLPPS
jgi:hypothetical protein